MARFRWTPMKLKPGVALPVAQQLHLHVPDLDGSSSTVRSSASGLHIMPSPRNGAADESIPIGLV
jgi:hypothetical protein